MRAADLLDDGLEPFVASRELVALGADGIALCNDGGMGGALRPDQCPQGINIIRQRFARMGLRGDNQDEREQRQSG